MGGYVGDSNPSINFIFNFVFNPNSKGPNLYPDTILRPLRFDQLPTENVVLTFMINFILQ